MEAEEPFALVAADALEGLVDRKPRPRRQELARQERAVSLLAESVTAARRP